MPCFYLTPKQDDFNQELQVLFGEGVVASISIFTDQAGAEESNRLAADYVRANLAALLQFLPEITTGEVKVHKAA